MTGAPIKIATTLIHINHINNNLLGALPKARSKVKPIPKVKSPPGKKKNIAVA